MRAGPLGLRFLANHLHRGCGGFPPQENILLHELEVIEDLTKLILLTLKMLSQYTDISEYEKELESITKRV